MAQRLDSSRTLGLPKCDMTRGAQVRFFDDKALDTELLGIVDIRGSVLLTRTA
jgi:hypothetical protein